MRRRSRAGRSVKPRRRKAIAPKRPSGTGTVRSLRSSGLESEAARLANELSATSKILRQRTNDLSESLEQQTATSEVLRVISSSQGELEPVFQATLEKAVRICEAKFGNVYRWDGDALSLVASHNTPSTLIEERRRALPAQPQNPLRSSDIGKEDSSRCRCHRRGSLR
jgi:hypothetical protein